MKRIRFRRFVLPIALLALIGVGCQTLKDVAGALSSFKQLQFKLGDTDNFTVNGVDISRLSNPSELGAMDVVKLTQAVAQKKLPVSFNLNVLAKNPNTTSGGAKATDLFIKRMAWTLTIDDRTTVDGVINQRLKVPGSGETVTIPMTISLDLMKFFGDKGYEDLLNLAFALGGVSGSSSRLKVGADVTVETPLGDVDYPGTITIVDTKFSNP